MKKLATMRGSVVALMFALAVMILGSFPQFRAIAQQGLVIPPNTILLGMMVVQGKPPVATGCTLLTNSTDTAGACVTTAASGTIVFAKTDMVNPPFCTVLDASATPVAVYTVTALQITLTTITTGGHVLRYRCDQQTN